MSFKWRIIVLIAMVSYSTLIATLATAVVSGNTSSEKLPIAIELAAFGAIAGLSALLFDSTMYALGLSIVVSPVNQAKLIARNSDLQCSCYSTAKDIWGYLCI